MIGVTMAVIAAIAALVFRSAFVPFRMMLCTALPISLVYGMGILVFQKGALNWLSPTLGDFDKIYWLIPVMSFSILVGLGLDYDIFLFSRVVEYRKRGYQDRAAIIKGVYKTGGIITGAGLIMAVAFGALSLSKEMALNQFAFFLCVAVLLDTFIVRSMMVPALVSLAGPLNWWPAKVPQAARDEYYVGDLKDTWNEVGVPRYMDDTPAVIGDYFPDMPSRTTRKIELKEMEGSAPPGGASSDQNGFALLEDRPTGS